MFTGLLFDGALIFGGIILGVLFPTVFAPLVTSTLSKFTKVSEQYDKLKAQLATEAASLVAQASDIKSTVAAADAPPKAPTPVA